MHMNLLLNKKTNEEDKPIVRTQMDPKWGANQSSQHLLTWVAAGEGQSKGNYKKNQKIPSVREKKQRLKLNKLLNNCTVSRRTCSYRCMQAEASPEKSKKREDEHHESPETVWKEVIAITICRAVRQKRADRGIAGKEELRTALTVSFLCFLW